MMCLLFGLNSRYLPYFKYVSSKDSDGYEHTGPPEPWLATPKSHWLTHRRNSTLVDSSEVYSAY